MVSPNKITVKQFCDDNKICYVKTLITLTTNNDGTIEKKTSSPPTGWKASVKHKGWDYKTCMEYNKHQPSHFNTILINLWDSPYMVIDIDSYDKPELTQSYLDKYGETWVTQSVSKKMPHLWRLKDVDDNSSTKIDKAAEIDFLKHTLFENPDSVFDFSNKPMETFCDFKKISEEKPKPIKIKTLPTVKSKTSTITTTNHNETIVPYLNLIPSDDYGVWTRVCWALHNDEDFDNYAIAKAWSKKCAGYDKVHFNEIWEASKPGNTLGTIYFLANKYEPYKYRQLYLDTNISVTDDNLADTFIKLNGDNVIYSNGNIYIYKQNWSQDCPKHYKLKKVIRETLADHILKVEVDFNQKLMKMSESEQKQQKTRKEEIHKIYEKVTSKTQIDNICQFVIQDLAILNTNVEFDINREQLYNLNFKNGVLNLNTKEFRKRTQTDYVTKWLDWNYNPKANNILKKELLKFYKKIQPNPEQLKFMLEWLAICLNGSTSRQKMKFNIGYKASNGKSTEFKIHNIVFPTYSMKLDSQTFELGNAKRHKQIISLVTCPIRFAYCEEMSDKKLDVNFLKDMVDGDQINCEVMYGTTVIHSIQAKISTCGNSDMNIFADGGIVRRATVQMYDSVFRRGETDDYVNHIYQLKEGYDKNFQNDEYKNAYLHLLLDYYNENMDFPKENEENFTDITNDYDEYGNILSSNFEITGDNEVDRVGKDKLHNIFKDKLNKPTLTWATFLRECKQRGLTYNKNLRCDGVKGCFVGIKSLVDDDVDDVDGI